MGGLTSKLPPDEQAVQTQTPKRVLAIDPRSPSGNISRTPITVTATPDSKDESKIPQRLKSLMLDPRSPSQDYNRTPIQAEENVTPYQSQKYQPTKQSKLAQAMPLLPDECQTAQVAKDPRSPTDQVPRTPLQEDIDLNSLSLKENNEETQLNNDILSKGGQLPSNGKSEDAVSEKDRRPLANVQNHSISHNPKAALQAKQCKAVEDEYFRNEENNILNLQLLKDQPTDEIRTSSTLVENI